MTTLGMEFQESRGAARHPANYISVPENGELHAATKDVWPWAPCNHEDNRMILASVYLEEPFGKSPVQEPSGLRPLKFSERCLGIDEFLGEAWEFLKDSGIFITQDEDGNDVPKVYESLFELFKWTNEVILMHPDEPSLQITADSFEWLEGFANNAGTRDDHIAWFVNGLNLEMLTEGTGDLTHYVELKLTVGMHGTEASRIDPAGVFYTMVGAGQGGQLAEVLKKYYFPGSTAVMHPNFLLRKLPGFLEEAAWPMEFDKPLKAWEDYAYDFNSKGALKTASRAQVAVILQPKLPAAITEHYDQLWTLLEDYIPQPQNLVKAVEALGDEVPGVDKTRSPLLQLGTMDDWLEQNWSESIQADYDADLSSEETLRRLLEKMRGSKLSDAGKGSASRAEDEDYRAPKSGQVARALAERAYVQLEAEYMAELRTNTMSNVKKIQMLCTCFASSTVMTNAVLFNTKGMRISVYVNSTGADFLALLHGERHLLSLYLFQTLAYDKDAGEVPADLVNVSLSQEETDKITNLEWHKRDRLNGIILKIKSAEAGTVFDKHDASNLYHSMEMLELVTDLDGKLYIGIGYPESVTEEEGVTFRKFM